MSQFPFIAASIAAFLGLVWLAERHSILAAGAVLVLLAAIATALM